MAHRIFLDSLTPGADRLTISGEEAEHARRVKRLAPGDGVTVMNGRGLVLEASVEEARRDLVLRATSERVEPPVTPRVEVWGATPKGPRLGDMIDALTQVGAASWRPLRTKRAVVEPGEGKSARMERIVREGCKQSGRAWLMTIDESATMEEALRAAPGVAALIADASGAACPPIEAATARLLVGPEGGFTPEELSAARAAGASVVNLGPHTMRVEVAAPVGVALILAASRR